MKKLYSSALSVPCWIWLSLLGLLYYLLISQNLFVCDDFGYAMGQHGRVSGLSDIIESQVKHYFSVNGRFLVHCFVMLFAGIWGIEAFRIVSSIVFVAFLYCLYRLCGEPRRQVFWIPVSFLLLCLCHPLFNISFLGNIATVINYLWATLSFLVYLLLLERVQTKPYNIIVTAVLSFFAFFCGALHEGLAIGGAVGSFLQFWLFRKNLNRTFTSMIVFFCLGAVFVVCAPANFARAAANASGPIWYSVIANFCRVITDCWILVLLLLIIFFTSFRFKQKFIQFALQNIVLLSVVVIGLLFAFLIAYIGAHQLTGPIVCAVILFSRWISVFFPDLLIKVKTPICVISVLFIVGLSPFVIQYRSEVHDAYYKMYESAEKSRDGIFYSQEYDSLSYRNQNWLQFHFTSSELLQDFPMPRVSRYFTNGHNSSFISTRLPYPKPVIIGVCNEKYLFKDGVYHIPNTFFYIIRLDQEYIQDNKDIEFSVFQRNSTMGFLRNIVFGIENPRQSVSTLKFEDLSYFIEGGFLYAIIMFKEEFPVINIETIVR